MALDEEKLTAMLREQFFRDGEDLVAELVNYADAFSDQPGESLRGMLRVAHNLKGAAQLSGLSTFGLNMHQFESALEQWVGKDIDHNLIQTCALYIKRLGGLVSRFYRALEQNAEFDSRDTVNWDAALEGMKGAMAEVSTAVEPVAMASSPASDDWGLNDLVKKDSIPEVAAPVAVAAESQKVDWDKGWGLFDDTPTVAASPELTPLAPPIPIKSVSKNTDIPTQSVPLETANKLIAAKKEQQNVVGRDVYLICQNKGASFAIPVRYVQEILPNRPDKPLPVKRDKISGVISFRGQVMAIVSLLDQESEVDVGQSNRCIVVCQMDKKQFGFRVDEVNTVVDVLDDVLQPLPGVTNDRSVVRSLGQVDGRTVSFVDPRMVFQA